MSALTESTVQLDTVGICDQCGRRSSIWECEAFPGGIPRLILVGEMDHRKPLPGDNGLQYTPSP